MKYCADCCSMDETPNKDGLFKCLNCRKSGYDVVSARKEACSHITEAFNSRRSETDRERFMQISRKHGYYIVTAITSILNIENQQEYLDRFAYFREVLMPQIEGGQEWLDDYDKFGPIIAERLKDEDNASLKAKDIFMSYIDPFNTFMENGEFDSALELYQIMYNKLKVKYGFTPQPKKLELK